MPKRLVIPVEFSSIKEEEILLYAKLKGYSSPGSIIKDILKGKLPVSILNFQEDLNHEER